MISYYRSIVTILYRLQRIATYWSKIAKFIYPTWPRRTFAKTF